jgi:ATP-dependent Lon protease
MVTRMKRRTSLAKNLPSPSALKRLTPDQLRWRTDPRDLPFETTEELAAAAFTFGQPRAEEALKLCLQMKNAGHIFVCGPPGTTRKRLIESTLAEREEPHSPLHDFLSAYLPVDPPRSYLLCLPAGSGRSFQQEVGRCIERCQETVYHLLLQPVFQSETAPDMDEIARCIREAEARVDEILGDLRGGGETPNATAYREDLKTCIHRTMKSFHGALALFGPRSMERPDMGSLPGAIDRLSAFRLHLIRESTDGRVPLLFESHPTLSNLFGTFIHRDDRSERIPWDTVFFRPGSLLLAQGGFLVFDFEEAVREPGVWTYLKRCLKDRRLGLPGEDAGGAGKLSFLPPDTVPFETRLVAWGDETIYQEFYEKDPDFSRLFKLRADLSGQMDRNEETVGRYMAFLKRCCEEEALPPFHRTGAAAFLDAGAELAGRRTKLTTHWEELSDILCESAHRATRESSPLVTGAHVERTWEERRFRRNLPEEQTREMFQDGSLLIQTEGEAVGQVNGIALCETEDHAFGKPFRITAQTGVGRSGIINIEREANLSGKLHDKGVLILHGFLRERYARNRPLNLSASLCIEQLYSHIDGDSASLGEICALLSNLANVPLCQGMAVTGSISQRGDVQPVGNVNEKILGFFSLCRSRGFTGDQGVLLPQANVQDLMLPESVLNVVGEGTFHLFAVQTVDEAMEILSRLETGRLNPQGDYPEGTLHRRVSERLQEMSRGLRDGFGDDENPTEDG